ncbi:MAG: hypothetical protein U0W24_20485 [Bacteroidales bacterium]
MKAIFILILVLATPNLNLFSQYSYTEYKKTRQIYIENFKNKGGKVRIEAGNIEPNRYIESFAFPENINFEIEGELENINATQNKHGIAGIYFGYYAFCINSKSEFSIMVDGEGIYSTFNFTQSDKIKKGKNKLTLRRISDTYYFFINETFVYQTKDVSVLDILEEGVLGFLAMHNTSLYAYKLEVNHIESIYSATR